MSFLGKTFGVIIATGAFLFAGALLVAGMAEALNGILEAENGKAADKR